MKILFVAPELKGMLSVGGLGEVALALAYALTKAGHDVRIAMPYYKYLDNEGKIPKNLSPIWKGKLNMGDLPDAAVYKTSIEFGNKNIPLYLVHGHKWFSGVVKNENVYSESPEPYFFLPAAVLCFLSKTSDNWLPDLCHCHDYHSGLLSVYLKTVFNGEIAGKKIATVFTIHSLAFQGIGKVSLLNYGGLPPQLGNFSNGLQGMEFYNSINCLKGAIAYSDMTSTVSKTYTLEIQTKEQGKGLDGVLTEMNKLGRLRGIVNGIDNKWWDPMKLPDFAFSVKNLTNKEKAKEDLRKSCGLESSDDPIIGLRSRWSYQKGIELLLLALRKYELHKKAQIIVVGWGQTKEDPEYLGLWYELIGWAKSFPGRIAFDNSIDTKKHYAGSDMFLMPSLFEPCGLGQMEAMRYGTIPIVRKTGGLADTITDDFGFVFEWNFREPLDGMQKKTGADLMMKAIEKALEKYKNKKVWEEIVKNAMAQNNDWSIRVHEYENLYNKALKG